MSRGGRVAGAVLCLGVFAACEGLLVEPAELDGDLEFQIVLENPPSAAISYGDLSTAFLAVESVWFRLVREGATRDTAVAAVALRDSVRTRALLRPEEVRGWLEIQAELRMTDGSPLFRGRTVFNPSRVSPRVQIDLVPVVSDIYTPRIEQDVSALGDTIDLVAYPRLANGDWLDVSTLVWRSQDPGVVDVVSQGRAVSRSSGSTALTASALGVERTFVFRVRQVPVFLTGVGPDTTVVVGGTYQARPFGADRNGFPLLPDASVTWSAEGSVQIDDQGVVTAVSPGEGMVRATSGSQTRTAHVVVIP